MANRMEDEDDDADDDEDDEEPATPYPDGVIIDEDVDEELEALERGASSPTPSDLKHVLNDSMIEVRPRLNLSVLPDAVVLLGLNS